MKHSPKLTSLTIITAISVLSICAQAPEARPPERRSFKHGVKIFEDYVVLADATLVKSKNIRVLRDKSGHIEMSAEFSSPGKRIVTPPSILLEFISDSKAPRYDFSTQLTLVVDGEEIPFAATKRVLFIFKGGFLETMVTPIPYQTFLKVANSKTVRVKLGPTDFALDEKPMEVLRDVASRTAPSGVRVVLDGPNNSLHRSAGQHASQPCS